MADSRALFATYRDGVFRYLSRIVGPAEAPDLTQEVFLRMTRGPAPEEPPEAQRAWIFRIARNLALNHRRDLRRRPTVALPEVPRSPSQEAAAAVREALDRLPAVDRDVFLLREAAGLSYDEIALACELSPDAVRSRLHRARQRLRECLAPLARQTVSMKVSSHGQS